MTNNEFHGTPVVEFFWIRDIPYRIGISSEQEDYSCATKPLQLAKIFKNYGITSRRILCDFSWTELGLPKHLLALAPSDMDTHEFLEIKLPNSSDWIAVDPTWDSCLKSAGFTIGNWDGKTATALGVKPLKIYTPDESAEIIKNEDQDSPEIRERYLLDNKIFFKALNRWFQSFRDTRDL